MPLPRSPKNAKRRLLCEGWIEHDQAGEVTHQGVVYLHEMAYCRQGEKVWFAEGRDSARGKSLCESEGFNGLQIVENIDDMELVERTLPNGGVTKLPKDGQWFVEGPGQRSDVVNANKRKYGRKIWERIIADPKSKQQQTIAARGMVGHLEHPADGRTAGKELALLTVESRLDKDGVVWAKHELLDTPNGLILQELTRKRVRWGVSTRGVGTVDESGAVNEDDYDMECWDAVIRPSTPGAYAAPSSAKTKTTTSEGLTEADHQAATTLVESVKALTETALPESAQATLQLIAQLTKKTHDAGGMILSGGMTVDQTNELFGWLSHKLQEASEHYERTLANEFVTHNINITEDAKADRAVAEAAESEVLESLQTQLNEASTESETLRATVADLTSRLAVSESSKKAAYKLVESAEADLERTTAALTAATELFIDEAGDASVDMALLVEAVLTANPALQTFKQILAEAPDPHILAETVKELRQMKHTLDTVTKVNESTVVEAETPPLRRAGLPVGNITAVKVGAPPRIEEAVTPLPPASQKRVALTAAIIGKMGTRRS